jgi:hypothetical protein
MAEKVHASQILSLHAEVKALLAELGTSPQEVADKLMSLGIWGHKGSVPSCPIARYLQRRRPGPQYLVETGKVAVVVDIKTDGDPFPVNYWVDVDMPDPVFDFIVNFDAGEYEELRDFRVKGLW